MKLLMLSPILLLISCSSVPLSPTLIESDKDSVVVAAKEEVKNDIEDGCYTINDILYRSYDNVKGKVEDEDRVKIKRDFKAIKDELRRIMDASQVDRIEIERSNSHDSEWFTTTNLILMFGILIIFILNTIQVIRRRP